MGITITNRALIIAFLTLAFISCKSRVETPLENPSPQVISPQVSYLALGDSYTIGEGVQESQRWPNQLSRKLKENNYDVIRTDIIAQTGWRTDNLLDAIAASQLDTYNLVSLLIGVNNQFQNRPFEVFTTEFDSLLNIAISLAGGKDKVFVLSIPDYGVTPFGSADSQKIGEELDMYNSYMNEKCSSQAIPFVNITEISRSLGASTGALAADNLHPSGSQYGEWVEEAFPVVIELAMK